MNRYENIIIIDADVGEDEKKGLTERLETLISQRNGELIEFDDWGTRKLAYEIKKKRQGQYLRVDFCGTGELVNAIERLLRHDHRILRFMTVLMEENADPEALKAAFAKEEETAEQPAETEPEEAATVEPAAEVAEAEAESAPTASEEEE